MGVPDHFTCLLRNLYEGQEATVRTLYGTTEWLKTEKGVQQGSLLSLYLFNLYAEHIMSNARLEELQAGIKIGGRNINKLRYADDTTLMEESEEALKNLLIRVKEESEKANLKLNVKQNKTRLWQLHHFMANRRGKVEAVTDFLILGAKNHCRWWLQSWN